VTSRRRPVCPLHAWRFDLETGRCVSGDAAAIRIYPVRHIDGRVVVWL
jgi:nitrite reductase/ring-hydroxylating ferredoxin subunit